ncbi:MAG: Rhodanese domain protein [Chloroflexi bacterium]|nr:Rhodanese domain protein [Chloroflexota bacterium]
MNPPIDDILVDAEWLAQHIDDPSVLVADCQYHDDPASALAAYRKGHISGAVHVYWPRDLAVGTPPVTNLIPPPTQAASLLGHLGIGNDTTVVGYDVEGGHQAARLWLVLAYYGHDRFKLLNGGLQRWVASGGPVSTTDEARPEAIFRPRPAREQMRIRADELRDRLAEPGFVVADVRRPTEFDGTERRAARAGHIPGARNLFWQDNVRDDWTFCMPAEVRARHEAAGVTPTCEVVTYCQAGVRAAHAALALRLAGYPRVRVYDGSWSEWGNDLSLPIER